MTAAPRAGRGPVRIVVHGLVAEAPVPLPFTAPAVSGAADLALEMLPAAFPTAPPAPLSPQIDGPRGDPWLSTGRLPGGGLFLRFAGLADFKVDPAGRRVLCRPGIGCSPERAVELFADAVVPFLLDHRGDVVLHAGAAALPGGAVAILGTGGAGKSTLVAALGRAGLPILGDDVFVARRTGKAWVAVPGLRRIDLGEDSLRILGIPVPEGRDEEGEKYRLLEGDASVRFAEEPVPLRAVLVLDSPAPAAAGAPRVEAPLRPKDAVAVLADHLFRADRQDPARYDSELDRLCALAGDVPLRPLRSHRGEGSLPATLAAIRAAVDTGAGGGA